MGFRSTFITTDYALQYPKWFKDKWEDNVFFGKENTVLASKHEGKTYGLWLDLETDLQRVVKKWEKDRNVSELILIYLHECEGITKLKITKDKITYSEPTGWKETDGVEHNYCYNCSEV